MSNIEWPPEYTVRKSKRAKRLRLSISQQKGLEIILPYRATYQEAEALLLEHRSWVEKHLQKIATQTSIKKMNVLPTEIFLRCVEQQWNIEYQKDNKRIRLIEIEHNKLLIQGLTDFSKSKLLLKKWLAKQAKIILSPWLTELSHETKLPYASLSIRGQLFRWGSCSAKKDINLNYKLLFLPAELVEITLLHELCHTVHLNHSEKFWNLMLHYNPEALNLTKQTKKAQQYVPSWMD